MNSYVYPQRYVTCCLLNDFAYIFSDQSRCIIVVFRMNTQSITNSHLDCFDYRDGVMQEYLCENCTIAYCFDDCRSPLVQKEMIEVEELVRRIDVEHDSEKSKQGIEDRC